MCFETTKSAKAKIAETDIECWKILTKANYNPYVWAGRIKYKKDVIQPIVKLILYPSWESTMEIEQGYHSFKVGIVLKEALLGRTVLQHKPIKKFIIPAGTRYFENETEYVSETIMLKE